MSDTGTFPLPAAHRVSTPVTADPTPTGWCCVLVSSVEEAEARLNELAAAGCEHQLVVLGPGVFAIEWR